MAMQQWFTDARLGIFLHWGIYAVRGVAESWSMYFGDLSREEYLAQLDGFTASRYDPQELAELIAASGAGYAVLTAKHHDGVALWDTAVSDLSVPKRTPAGRDLVGPYVDALRARGIRVGLYFSHCDWSHPDYPTMRHLHTPEPLWDNPMAQADEGAEDPGRWERYLAFRNAQVEELVTRYQPDLLWFDGEWERTAEQWRMEELRDLIVRHAPRAVCNARLAEYGDYATPEQAMPVHAPDGPWELCLTMGRSWGYQPDHDEQKSLEQLVRYLTEVASLGGNLLLGVGPREDGTIPEEQADRLRALGRWVARHHESLHSVLPGLPPGHHYGPSTLSQDRRTLYLTFFGSPGEVVSVRGLRNAVVKARVLGTGAQLPVSQDLGLHEAPGTTWVTAPRGADLDPTATVVALELDGPLDLYTGAGRT
jgi:alpha-L-fucosidase